MKLSKEYRKAWFAKHPLYPAWQSMRRNCGIIKGATEYTRRIYAGVGICKEWLKSYAVFENWAIANGWKPGMQVARNDKFGDFCPENCVATTWEVNVNMRRNTARVSGMSLRDYIGRHTTGRGDSDYKRIRDRLIKCKWDPVSSVEMPKMTKSQSQSVQARSMRERKCS